MVFDRTENEPEEWDPEEGFYDPESDGLTIPQVSTGDDDSDADADRVTAIDAPEISTAETDAPADLLQTFWALVLVINAAVMAVSLGVLFLVFEGALTRSAALLAAGFVLFVLAGRRYRRFNDDSGTDGGSDTDAGSEADDGTGSGPDPDAGPESDPSSVESPPNDAAETTSGDAPQHRSPTRNDSP